MTSPLCAYQRVAVASVCLGISFATATLVYAKASEAPEVPLKVSIRTKKPRYTIGEELTIFVKVENVDRDPAGYPARLYETDFEFIFPDGQGVAVGPHWSPEPGQRLMFGWKRGRMAAVLLRSGQTTEFSHKCPLALFTSPDNDEKQSVISVEIPRADTTWAVHDPDHQGSQPEMYYLRGGFGAYKLQGHYDVWQIESQETRDRTILRDVLFPVSSNVITVDIQPALQDAAP